MLSAIRRTWPLGSSCSRTRVMSSEASPLFLRSPLIISFLLCLYDHHFYYNPFNALREINAWTKCVAIDCSIWTLWLSWEERTLAPPMFLFLCVSSLLYCPHWMQKQLLFFRGNTRDYGSYRRLYVPGLCMLESHAFAWLNAFLLKNQCNLNKFIYCFHCFLCYFIAWRTKLENRI